MKPHPRARRYVEPKPGEWVQPIRRGYRMRCCDCALVHRMDFRVQDGHVQFRVWRDNRTTAALRRGRLWFIGKTDMVVAAIRACRKAGVTKR